MRIYALIAVVAATCCAVADAAVLGLVGTNAVVVRVVDGDTFDARSGGDIVRVRILKIDAAETSHAHCPEERRLGLRAAARLRQLLPVGRPVTLDGHRRDKYGRLLASVTTIASGIKIDVGAKMLAEGLARAYDGRKRRPWCFSEE